MESLHIHLLGTFEVCKNGSEAVIFATDKARALLSYLVVEHQRAHSRESLANLLWPEQSEERARQNLRQALLHIRQSLGDDASAILNVTTQTVQIMPNGSVSSDVSQLLQILETCRNHIHRSVDRCYPCLVHQQQIVDLYQGEFLQGFSINSSEAFEEWVLLTREVLHRSVMQSLNSLADLFETSGDLEKALTYARRMVQFEPWREETHRQLMRLLASDGQYSAALVQYKLCQRMVEKEFGTEPAAETTALLQAIKNGNTARIALRTAARAVLAPSTSAFIGRATELMEITERLANPDCHLLTLLGPGGSGKTRLAMQIAQLLHGLYPDGIYYLSLNPFQSFDEFILLLLDALKIPISQGANTALILAGVLKNKGMLLILDNFENLLEQSPRLAELLTQNPDLQILVTSRERLQLREEWVYAMEGFAVPPENFDPQTVMEYDALRLFENRAMQLDQRFRLSQLHLPAAVSICRLLEGSPLGIELSAVAAAERGCGVVSTELQETLGSISSSIRNIPARHTNLRAVFDQSWQLLSESEQTRLAVLAIFPGSYTVESAAAVASVSSAQLKSLSAKSLLREENDQRFSFHAIIHEFAREKLNLDTINVGIIQRKHALTFADLAQALSSNTQLAKENVNMLVQEQKNFVQAWRWCLSADDAEEIAGRLLPALITLYHQRGPMAEGISLLNESLTLIRSKSIQHSSLYQKVQFELISLLGSQGNFAEALALIDQAATETEASAEPLERYQLLFARGRIFAMQGETIAARPILENALELAKILEESLYVANCHRELGTIAMREGDSLAGRTHFLQSLAYYEETANLPGMCSLSNNIGISYYDTGELDEATRWLEKALDMYDAIGDQRGKAKALNNLSNIMADRGRLTETFAHLKSALEIHQQIGNISGQAAVYNNMGSLNLYLGQFQQAENDYQQALQIHTEGGNRQAQAETLGNLGLLAGIQGKCETAMTLLQQAETLSHECGDKINASNVLFFRVRVEKDMRKYQQAEQHLKQCTELRQIVPNAAKQMETEVEKAHLKVLQGENETALKLLEPILAQLCLENLPEGLEDPLRMYWLAYEILTANHDTRAHALILKAQTHLNHLSGQISDPVLRTSFLENYTTHRLVRSVSLP